jgi:hypothetical protein
MIFLLGAWSTLLSCTSQTTPETVDELMKRLSEQYHDTIIKTPYATPASYMEKATCDGEYCMYTEAMGFIYSFGYDYEIQTGNFIFLPKNFKKSDRQPSWLKTLDNWYADVPNITHRSDFPPGYGSLFSAFRWFEIHGPLGEPRSFTYEITDTLETQHMNKSLIKLEFKSAGGREYTGTFYIDSKTLSIHRVQLDKMLFHSQNFRQWIWVKGEFSWRSEKDYTSIASLKLTFIKDSIEYWIELETLPLLIQDPKMDESELQAIAFIVNNPYVSYQGDEWPISSPFSKINMDSIKHSMEGIRTLEEQFQANAGRPFFTNTYQNGSKFTVVGEEDTYKLVEEIVNRLEQKSKLREK